MKLKLIIVFSFFVIIISCKQRPKETVAVDIAEEIVVEPKLPELEDGEVFYKDKNPFGEIAPLYGEQVIIDTVIFKVGGAEMLVKDNLLVIKNRVEDNFFMQFKLPDFELQSLNGIYGKGPDEFLYPHIVPTDNSSLLCYIFESTNQKLYKFDKKGKLHFSPLLLSPSKQGTYSDKQLVNVGVDDFMYAETSSTGKSIYRVTQIADSMIVKEVFNLGLNPKRKSWVNYIGDFAVNAKQNRMVYAYKYFKIIKFMDLEAQTVRTINFEREEFDESTLYKIDGMDQNVTHYWGVCGQDKYVYFLYSGRTPMDVMRDNNKNQYYIHVEQFDWNGNPVAKYKLDHWGYFTVDENNKRLYLLSTNDDDPVFIYQLPE